MPLWLSLPVALGLGHQQKSFLASTEPVSTDCQDDGVTSLNVFLFFHFRTLAWEGCFFFPSCVDTPSSYHHIFYLTICSDLCSPSLPGLTERQGAHQFEPPLLQQQLRQKGRTCLLLCLPGGEAQERWPGTSNSCFLPSTSPPMKCCLWSDIRWFLFIIKKTSIHAATDYPHLANIPLAKGQKELEYAAPRMAPGGVPSTFERNVAPLYLFPSTKLKCVLRLRCKYPPNRIILKKPTLQTKNLICGGQTLRWPPARSTSLWSTLPNVGGTRDLCLTDEIWWLDVTFVNWE